MTALCPQCGALTASSLVPCESCALQSSTTQAAPLPPKRKKRLRWWVCLTTLVVLAGGFAIFSSLPYYWWARFRNDAEGYEAFARNFGDSPYVIDAASRARVMNDDKFWQTVSAADTADLLGRYLIIYPAGKHAEEAKARHRQHADSAWPALAQSRSERDLRAFVAEFASSGGPRVADAQSRLHDLLEDVEWVLTQEMPDVGRRFLNDHPTHPKAGMIEKRIIDLEVRHAAVFRHNELIPPQLVRSGGDTAKVTVDNKTGDELVLLYSGPDSKKQKIAVGKTDSVSLVPGDYQVTMSGGADTPSYGTVSFVAGDYFLSLEVKITSVPAQKR